MAKERGDRALIGEVNYYLRSGEDYQWCEHRCEHIFKMKAMLYRVAPWVRYIWV